MTKKQALISGAAGGLGTAVTKVFLEAGYELTALTNPKQPDEKEKLREATGRSDRLSIAAVNAFRASDVKEFLDERYAQHKLQAAVFLVGGFGMGKLEDTSEEEIDKMIQLNFKTAYNFVRHGLPHMAKNSRIILIGARPALQPSAATDMIAYSISKGMVVQLAGIVNELGKDDNIQAVTVIPSIIDTPANREAMPDADYDDWVKPEEIARAMIFACSADGLKQRGARYKMYGNV